MAAAVAAPCRAAWDCRQPLVRSRSAHTQIELIPQAAAGAAGGGGAGGPRTLSSGIRISGERGGARMVQLTRHFQQAAPKVVRGRGSVRGGGSRGGVAAMQE